MKVAKLSDTVDMLLDAGQITYSEFYKMKNYAHIAEKADRYRKELSEIPPQSLDWHVRMLEACGSISDDEMQELWARILAGEIEQPGSYSLRTFECLKNLSTEEAVLFKKVCDCSIRIGNNVFLPRFRNIMEENGIINDDVLKLEDCGLMKSDVGMSLGMSVTDQYSVLSHNEKDIMVARKREETNKRAGLIFHSIYLQRM